MPIAEFSNAVRHRCSFCCRARFSLANVWSSSPKPANRPFGVPPGKRRNQSRRGRSSGWRTNPPVTLHMTGVSFEGRMFKQPGIPSEFREQWRRYLESLSGPSATRASRGFPTNSGDRRPKSFDAPGFTATIFPPGSTSSIGSGRPSMMSERSRNAIDAHLWVSFNLLRCLRVFSPLGRFPAPGLAWDAPPWVACFALPRPEWLRPATCVKLLPKDTSNRAEMINLMKAVEKPFGEADQTRMLQAGSAVFA